MNADFQNTLSDSYPASVQFTDHYSIFLLGFQHGVTFQKLNNEAYRNEYARSLFNFGWRPHDVALPEEGRSNRPFSPDSIFSPQAYPYAFGESQFESGEITLATLSEHLRQRFDPTKGVAGFSEPIVLTMDSPQWLKKKLRCGRGSTSSESAFDFEIDWVDLWLMGDGSGFIAFKAKQHGDCTITSLSSMNLTLRDRTIGSVFVHGNNSKENEQLLWDDLIFKQWLGFESDDSVASVVLMNVDACKKPIQSPGDVFDRFQRNCKILVFAQTPDLNDEDAQAWSWPLSDPMVQVNHDHEEKALDSGSWNLTSIAAQNATIAGYATVRDMVCFELATFSERGGSLGWNGKREWQYGLEYIRKVVNEQFIDVWEYWAGLVLRDTCVFVSHDKSMPISWQAEARYYPLYLYAYHLRYRLDYLSQQVIDHDMADADQGRKLRDQFQRFRNHYWFHETTIDFLGKEVFDKMLIGLDVGKAFEMVNTEIDEVSKHVREKWDMVIGVLISAWVIITSLTSFEAGKYMLGILALFFSLLGVVYYKNPNHALLSKVADVWNTSYKGILRLFGRL